ncbi:MAG TPA: DUF4920 domain-containing protein [Sandaracinaceae bacterium]
MTREALTLLLTFALGACGGAAAERAEPAHAGHHHGEHDGHGEPAAEPRPARVLEDGSRLFGSEPSDEREVVALGAILAAPEQYRGQVVKTEGEITQVCQRMGCWMELRADARSPGIRVPMAGHGFFLPRDVVGSRATVEGTVRVEPLSERERAHLESEGATATDQDVSIEATSVLVHP